MLRSLMTAVTGVRAHQTMLDVTGNNIANVNTVGYKKDFTVFQDLLYQTTQGATGPGANRGGINPAQVGLGVSVAAIETIHTQGPAQFTGNKTDMMIQGDGFFVLRNGGSRMYSRAGNFVRDAASDLVHSGTGYKVQGYKMERDPLNPQKYLQGSEPVDINIPIGKKMAPRGTSLVDFQCNLDSRSAAYLPIGYMDLPFNEECGTPGNPSGVAKVTINGVEHSMKFWTTPDNGGTAPANGEKYFTITYNDGAAEGKLEMDMLGIKDGLPQLYFPGTTPPATSSEIEIKMPSTAANNNVKVTYDNTTGLLRFKDKATGALHLEMNLQSKMDYASFSVKDKDAKETRVLAEFNEKWPHLSSMGKRELSMTLWYEQEGTPGVKSEVVTVPVKADGTFDFEKLPLTVPGFTAGQLKIIPGSNGSALQFQRVKDLTKEGAALDKAEFETTKQVFIGGFHQTKQTIYDCQGNPQTLEVNFKKITENRWRWEAFLLEGTLNKQTGQCEDASGNVVNKLSSIQPVPSSGELAFCGCGPIGKAYPEESEIEIPFSLEGKTNQKIKLDFSGHGDVLKGVTQFASETTTKAVFQDGYKMGVLNDFNIGRDGTITGLYTNDQTQPVYRLALATFTNPQGLDKQGDAMFRETVNSGQANIDAATVNGKGAVVGGNLEMSNVDLTEEFTRLIISQRGFQANTRVVTTSDQILEEVVNLKR